MTRYLMFKLKDFIDFCTYTLILNLITATHFKPVGTETTGDWDLGEHPKHLIGTVTRLFKWCYHMNSLNSLNSIHHCIVKYIHPEILPHSLSFSSSELHWRKVEKWATVWQVHSFDCFWNLWMLCPPVWGGKGPSRCYHHKVQLASICDGLVHSWANLYICKRPINAERYIQVLDQHMLPSRDVTAYSNKTGPSHIQQWGFVVKNLGTRLACLQSRTVSSWKFVLTVDSYISHD